MSFREEDNQKNCPSRGLGLAAAAIGVGVGAALYYLFSKRTENPTTSGSTTREWNCESDLTFLEESGSSEHSYITLSEHTTTDSSIIDDDECFCISNTVVFGNVSDNEISESDSDTDYENYITDNSDLNSLSSSINFNDSQDIISSLNYVTETLSNDTTVDVELDVTLYENYITDDSDLNSLSSSINLNDSQDIISSLNYVTGTLSNDITDDMEWDVTSTVDIPSYTYISNNRINNLYKRFSTRSNRNDTDSATAQVFRERSKTLEQCSICFDIILQDQESMILPCTHYFHTSCILPWLQEQQTCPNCRIAVD